ncbi:MAG: hypothetical protein U9N49_04715 [Campylobacterota bacterium]|nr:hypothetical protein [Campylobacterota bacterium]
MLSRLILSLMVVLVITSCGGGGSSSDDKEVNNTNLVESNTIIVNDEVIDQNAIDFTQVSLEENKTLYVKDKEFLKSLKENKILILPAGKDERFPFGMLAQIKSIEGNKIELSDIPLSQVFKSLSKENNTFALSQSNLISVITPNGVTTNTDSNLSLSNGDKVFMNGGVVLKKSSNRNFRGILGDEDNSNIDHEIALNLKLDLSELLNLSEYDLEPSNYFPFGTSKNLSVSLTGSIKNLTFEEEFEILDLDNLSEELAFKTIARGEFYPKLEIKGKSKATLGFYDDIWKDTESALLDTLTGLSSSDKLGKIPVMGLILSSPTPFTTMSTESVLDSLNLGGVILWVYVNLKGELSLEGSVGLQANTNLALSKKVWVTLHLKTLKPSINS